MDTIRLKARAKINLGLDVVRRREDGYHEVKMVMQMLRLYDQIDIEKTQESGIFVRSNLSFLPTDERNIAYKAAKVMIDQFGLEQGVIIRIEKHIPVAAGMAGGSTDCAAVLYGMNKLFGLRLNQKKLRELGVKLGADVPYCLMRQTALSEGIGEILTPISPLQDCPILIAKPSVSVSTRHVYEHLKLDEQTMHPDIDGIVTALADGDLYGVTDRMANVLETVTVPEHPVIDEIKKQMMASGAVNALMSGSGPTVFGIFDDEEKAKKACEDMKASGLARQIYLTRPFNQKIKDTRKNKRKR
ncbi:MAG: 4-(cytidine 5'-diphospho)-2-C-methyl-D-erythritol kinase [Coprococcus sp.]|uniref:4-(cytidine 5'-diphospho)-2-C-methyl-D-erythritol kinase n=1 Tax=Coprococcus catus TaxID=116085 RepID=UPI001C01E984|nr:4-(cytidine 5'-diphospho)-2-C-methyl-D-erythritol kinase [Coprococcus catus]MBT9772369.1 4-(cytidine 5'-diphospho)-2-C-methyl-D-erythritol kinase [Coprococcus catus]